MFALATRWNRSKRFICRAVWDVKAGVASGVPIKAVRDDVVGGVVKADAVAASARTTGRLYRTMLVDGGVRLVDCRKVSLRTNGNTINSTRR